MIKTKTIKTDKAEILVIGGLTEGIKNMEIISERYKTDNCQSLRWVISKSYLPKDSIEIIIDIHNEEITLPPGNWQPLGFLDKIPEDVANELVEEGSYMKTFWNYIKNDTHKSNQLHSATESLHSLISANLLLKNPLGHCPVTTNKEFTDKWFEEQEKVFTNPFLLKRIN